jgi:hypothetical protein
MTSWRVQSDLPEILRRDSFSGRQNRKANGEAVSGFASALENGWLYGELRRIV